MPVRLHFGSEKALIFSIVQLILGLTSMILSVVLVASGSFIYFYGTGIWTGLLFIMTGAIGVFASRKKDDCTIITFMVASFIAIGAALCLLGFGAVGISQDANIPYGRLHRYVHYSHSRLILLHALMLIVAVIEILAAIYSVVICVRSICCRRVETGQPLQSQVQYHSQGMSGYGGQQVMIITSAPPGYGPYPGNPYGYLPGGQMVYTTAPYVTPQGLVQPGPVVDPNNPVSPGVQYTQVSPAQISTCPPTVPQYTPPLTLAVPPPGYSTIDRSGTTQVNGDTVADTSVAEESQDAVPPAQVALEENAVNELLNESQLESQTTHRDTNTA